MEIKANWYWHICAVCKITQAILHVMLDHPKEAKICWDDFQDIQGHFQWPPSFNEIQVDKVIIDFKEFEKVVKVLKDDITKAHAKKW